MPKKKAKSAEVVDPDVWRISGIVVECLAMAGKDSSSFARELKKNPGRAAEIVASYLVRILPFAEEHIRREDECHHRLLAAKGWVGIDEELENKIDVALQHIDRLHVRWLDELPRSGGMKRSKKPPRLVQRTFSRFLAARFVSADSTCYGAAQEVAALLYPNADADDLKGYADTIKEHITDVRTWRPWRK